MDTSTIILHIAIILIFARICGESAAYFKIPSVIGELTAGIILGPSLLGLVSFDGMIKVLAEIGIILLLFQIGLESNIGHLTKAGTKAGAVALGGALIPFILVYGLSYYVFDLSNLVSLLIAGTMTATSIGITMRTLNDLNRSDKPEGQVVLGAAVLDDILGVVLLALLFNFSTSGQIDLISAGRILLFMSIFFLVAPTLAKLFSYLIGRFEPASQIPGMIPTSIVALVLFLAWLSHAIGIPELLGGFATGLALSKRFFIPFGIALQTNEEFSNHLHHQIKPIIQLFTPIFFVAVGLSLDLSQVDWSSRFFWYFSICLTAVAILGKIAGALFLKEKLAVKIAIGMAMVPRGEVGLVFAELGKTSGLFNPEIYATVVIVIAYTTLFTPFWLRLYYRRYGRLLDEEKTGPD